MCYFGVPIGEEKNKYLSHRNLYKQFPFDSKRKRMTTFIKSEEFPSQYRLFSKGGGEYATSYCKYYLDPENGKIVQMNENCKRRIQESITNFNKDKLRTIYIAYKDITKEEFINYDKENDEGKLIDQYDMVFLAVFGFRNSFKDGL